MLYDTYGEEYLIFLQDLNEILSLNELVELDYLWSTLLKTKTPGIMANHNQDNVAYLNFLEDLNEILMDYNISRLSFS